MPSSLFSPDQVTIIGAMSVETYRENDLLFSTVLVKIVARIITPKLNALGSGSQVVNHVLSI